MQEFRNFHNFKKEIADEIINQDKLNNVEKELKNIEIEHFFIDFRYLIIGEKLRFHTFRNA